MADAFDAAMAGNGSSGARSHDDGSCQERAGFLFKHDCQHRGNYRCGRCSKAVCESHYHHDDASGEDLCTTCARALHKREARRTSPYSGNRFRDDRYFYGDRHYHGWGYYHAGYWGYHHYHSHHHDQHDFTEGDAAALAAEGDEAFEDSFDAS